MNAWNNIEWVLPLRSECLTPIMKLITDLGLPLYLIMMLFLSVGYWIWRKKTFRHLIILVMFTIVINFTLKALVKDPRPPSMYWLAHADLYGFPSGHAQLAVVIWLGLAYELKRLWGWIICSFITLAVCFSRLYLGVHDLNDVIYGALFGAITLILFYRYKDRVYRWFNPLSLPVQITLLVVVVGASLAFYPGPREMWMLSVASMILGQGIGLIVEDKYVRFSPPKAMWKRTTISVIGSLGIIFLSAAPLLPFYMLFGLWQTILAPLLFRRMKLCT